MRGNRTCKMKYEGDLSHSICVCTKCGSVMDCARIVEELYFKE